MLMDESVRLATERVPAWVGRSLLGGGRLVCCGSQSMALAEMSSLAMRSWGGVEWAAGAESGEGCGWAVVAVGSVAASPGFDVYIVLRVLVNSSRAATIGRVGAGG